MNLAKNKKGISVNSIILLGLLALSVVLLNGISISVKRAEAGQAKKSDLETVTSYCWRPHEKFPSECSITKIFACDSGYLATTDCFGVGDLILDKSGNYAGWCGYTVFGEPEEDCGRYWIDSGGKDCFKSNNLCQ